VALVFLFATQVHTTYTYAAQNITPEKQHPIVAQYITKLLKQYHYNHQEISDGVSSEMLDLYIQNLDRQRLYFIASDIAEFEKYRHSFDDKLNSGQLDVGFLIFNTFKLRVEQRMQYALNRVEAPFDFSVDEYYQVDREKAPWAKTTEELDDIWRKKVKHEALNLKLAGKDDTGISKTLGDRYRAINKRVQQYNSEEVFQSMINALAETYDPHTSYLSPIAAENFEIDMSLSFEGIGAQLITEDDYTKVVRILPGGPADRSKELWSDDKIVGVAQGHGEMLDVIGWRLDDVVKKIRGQKGTTVRLEIIPAQSVPGSPNKFLTLIRDEIVLEERAAKSETIELTHDGKKYKIGVINIPTFYSDLDAQRQGKKEYKSTTRDVRRLLTELKATGVDGILIDLRRNGGGSLQEAIELTGLFIKDGPVVQVRYSSGSVRVESDPDPELVYDGPMGVLVDRFSASASEIFAGAIQDYGRGLILGSRTFGKGTVQNLLSLDRIVNFADQRAGQLKVTVAKFYRVAGGSTQHRGVIPDISFPSVYDETVFGESTEMHALPWDEIAPSMFQPDDQVSKYLSSLRVTSKKRTERDIEFRFLSEDLERFRKERDEDYISLLEADRKAERETLESQKLNRVNERRKANGVALLKKGEEIPKDEKEPDAILVESERVMADLIAQTKAGQTAKISVDENTDSKKSQKTRGTAKADN
jgi:carboxyl-terminal processing protease